VSRFALCFARIEMKSLTQIGGEERRSMMTAEQKEGGETMKTKTNVKAGPGLGARI
jgi:hypothetical protein